MNVYVLASYSITGVALILYGIFLSQRRKSLSKPPKSNSGFIFAQIPVGQK